MLIALILGILLGGITVLFAVENLQMVTVSFLAWQGEAPLAILLLIGMFSGIAFTLLLLLPYVIRDELAARATRHAKRKLEDEFATYRTHNPNVQMPPPSPRVQTA